MIKKIVKDIEFLSKRAVVCTAEDLYIAQDLIDTLEANKSRCVGMAANMIGYNKSVIIVSDEGNFIVMFNPKIKSFKGEYETEEGCLSLVGERKCKRYEEIEVEYLDTDWNVQKAKYKGFTAEIIQHEVDHLKGIII